MVELPPELGPAQAPVTQGPETADFRSQMGPLTEGGGPAGAFVNELLGIASDLGMLDEAFGPPSVADQADELDINADPMEFLSKDQLTNLVNLFMAIPEPERTRIGDMLRKELPPQVAQRLEAIVRFVQGRDAQQEVIQ
jgi:hypothetical protein